MERQTMCKLPQQVGKMSSNSAIKCRHKEASSHPWNSSQSRDKVELFHVTLNTTYRSVIKAGSSLLDNEERQLKRRQREGEVCWVECEMNKKNKKKQAGEEEKIQTEVALEELSLYGRNWLFLVSCNTSKPAEPRRSNDRCNEHHTAGNKLINTVDYNEENQLGRYKKKSTGKSFSLWNLFRLEQTDCNKKLTCQPEL